MQLHAKLDDMRERYFAKLLEMQIEQMRLISELARLRAAGSDL